MLYLARGVFAPKRPFDASTIREQVTECSCHEMGGGPSTLTIQFGVVRLTLNSVQPRKHKNSDAPDLRLFEGVFNIFVLDPTKYGTVEVC